ncbi:GIY-YIG nuclease family protein [Halobacteriales archaeon Cl-PHB]
MSGVFDRDWLDLEWSPWLEPNTPADELSRVATDPGLYRVRHNAYDGLVYIGETGRNLRGRLRALFRGIYEGDMPYSDPHTASPCFWAIVDRHGPGFEVSTASPDAAENKQQRKALEDALLAVHRRETGRNTVGNFGRLPPGYSKSKQRSSGIRGGPSDDETKRSFRAGADPLSWQLPDDLTATDWMGLDWSGPEDLAQAASSAPRAGGVYRLWDPESHPPLEYIGQTVNLRSRLTTHRRNRSRSLSFSYAELPGLHDKYKLEQVETDLLGAHWLACGKAPSDQY